MTRIDLDLGGIEERPTRRLDEPPEWFTRRQSEEPPPERDPAFELHEQSYRELCPPLLQDKRLLTLDEVMTLPPLRWVVPGQVPEGVTRTFGAAGIGKTFHVLWEFLDVARCGHRVVYVAAEGASGMKSRIRAWRKHHGLTHLPKTFLLLKVPVDMLSPPAVEGFIRELRDFRPNDVVLDTQARCFGTGNENDPDDMNKFVLGCYRLKDGLRLRCLHLIHHTGKDPKKGARGHTGAFGALDMEREVVRTGEGYIVRCSKMRDGPEFPDRYYKLTKMHGSCVVLPSETPAQKAGKPPTGWTDALNVLDGPTPEEEWRAACYDEWQGETSDNKQKRFKRVRTYLLETGRVIIEDGEVRRA